MFCKYCGKPTEGDAPVCDACAAAQAVPQEDVFELTTPSAAPAKKNPFAGIKLPDKKILLTGIAAVVAVLLVASLLFGNGAAFFVKTFASPTAYMKYVEKQTLTQIGGAVTQVYGGALSAGTETSVSGAVETQISLKLGDAILATLAAAMDDPEGAGWLEDISMTVKANTKGQQAQTDVSLGLGKQELVCARVIVDLAEKAFWAGLPGLSEEYLMGDFSTLDELDFEQMEEQKALLEEAMKSLPSERQLGKLIKKYVKIALSHLGKGSKDTDTVRVDGIKQKLTVITLKVYEEDVLNMALDLLTTLREDEAAKDMIVTVLDSYDELYGYGMETDYAAMLDEGLEDAIESIEETLEDCGKEYIKIKDYVNSDHQVVGRSFSVKGSDEELSYITVWEGNEFAFEAVLPELEVTGRGSRKGGLIEAEYALNSYGETVLVLELEDWNEKRALQGNPKGIVTLIPGEDMLDEVLYETGLSYSQFGSLLSGGMELEIGLDCGKNKAAVDLSVNMNHTSLFTLSCTTKVSGGSAVKIPAESTQILTANGPDEAALTQWVSGLDFEKLLEALSKAEVPEALTDQLETAVDQLDMLLG